MGRSGSQRVNHESPRGNTRRRRVDPAWGARLRQGYGGSAVARSSRERRRRAPREVRKVGPPRSEKPGEPMRTRAIAFAVFMLLTVTVLAHHSAIAEYDLDKPVKVSGTVTRVEWSNPHIWFYVDVKNPDGTVTNWGFSGGAPGVLQRRGVSRTALKPGDQVVVQGFRAKDGSFNGSGDTVTFPDGRRVFTAMEGLKAQP